MRLDQIFLQSSVFSMHPLACAQVIRGDQGAQQRNALDCALTLHPWCGEDPAVEHTLATLQGGLLQALERNIRQDAA